MFSECLAFFIVESDIVLQCRHRGRMSWHTHAYILAVNGVIVTQSTGRVAKYQM